MKSTDIHDRVLLDVDKAALDALFGRIQAITPNDQGLLPAVSLALHVRNRLIADISVPVISLHGSSSGMDSDMRTALKADQHPAIEYDFEEERQQK